MDRYVFPWQHTLHQSSKHFFTALSLAVLTACGGGGGSSSTPTTPAPAPAPSPSPAPAPAPAPTPTTQLRFTNVTEEVGLAYLGAGRNEFPQSQQQSMTAGIAVADVNNDGHLDVYVTHGYALTGKLFTFDGTRYTEAAGAVPAANAQASGLFVDLDLDGDKDLLTMQTVSDGIIAYINQGEGNFVLSPVTHGLQTTKSTYGAAAADVDLDGDLDLYFTHFGIEWNDNSKAAYFYRQEETGTFTDLSDLVDIFPAEVFNEAEGGDRDSNLEELSFTPVFSDINQDGYPDLLVTGDFSSSQILINNAGIGFIDATTDVITDENGMGNVLSDFDRDGDIDWFVTSIWNPIEEKPYLGGESGNRFYSNDGQGSFADNTDLAGVREGFWGWGTCAADFDKDGHQDIFMTNGMVPVARTPDSETNPFLAFDEDPARLYMANGQGAFVESSVQAGLDHTGQGRGVACFDFDRDGDVDILIANNGQAPTLYRNDTETAHHYLNIALQGEAGNLDGIGARIIVTAGETQWVREIYAGSNYLSQEPAEATIGLGQIDTLSEVRIIWPNAERQETVLTDVSADQRLVVSLNN